LTAGIGPSPVHALDDRMQQDLVDVADHAHG
jgi:hypothetical protein